MSTNNYLKKIAIIGAGGQFGKFITKALLEQGKHNVTAVTRVDSKSTIPEGVHAIKKVDYSSHSSLVDAFRGQDALIITINAMNAATGQTALIEAAKDAGIQWIMPNEYGLDPADNEVLVKSTRMASLMTVRKQIEAAGLNWVGLACSFWYEFSLAGTEARYGFDFGKKALTLFDDGNTKIPTTTWPLASKAVARIFALPLESNHDDSLKDFKNRSFHVCSFFVNQRDMLASVLRVTGDKESDWTITSEPSKERYERGVKMMDGGDFEGFVILLYTRVFFPDGTSDFTGKLDNKKLGLLEEENIDDATKTMLEMVKVSSGHWSHHW